MTPRGGHAAGGPARRAHDRLGAIAAKSRARSHVGSSSRLDGQGTTRHPALPEEIEELLAEASPDTDLAFESPRPAKRRRVTDGPTSTAPVRAKASPVVRRESRRGKGASTAVNHEVQSLVISSDHDDEDEDDDDDEFDWEQVPLEKEHSSVDPDHAEPTQQYLDQDIADVSVTLDGPSKSQKRSVGRKTITNAERSKRLATHKTHVLFLLFHLHIRNAWCNNKRVESNLRSLLSAKIIKSMNPDPKWPQLRQSNTFVEGLKAAMDVWVTRFKYIAQGMEKARWIDDDHEMLMRIDKIDVDMDQVDKSDFVRASNNLKGSQDVCNQLFCAMLRAVGVDARLVCSLQPLAFSAAGAKIATPRKTIPQIFADEHGGSDFSNGDGDSSSDVTMLPSTRIGPVRPIRRIGQPSFGMPIGTYRQAPVKPKQKPVMKLMYPVFWVEVFNPAYQKWIAIDAAATKTVGRSAKLEPPANYLPNQLSYVVAVEDDGIMRDVTQRYAHAYNAKTRKLRVESTEGGDRWWKQALRPFRRIHKLDRDQLEETELISKASREGMPKNIQDFKDHPVYALDRHLKRHEVISPKREVGKVAVGKGSSAVLEPVYRRQDVLVVRSADKWYRLGRTIKPNEQALKHVTARSKKPYSDDVNSGEDDATECALYGFGQTQPYVPPPVVKGRITKNAFGNLDIYVPSMVPEGGVHLRHNLTARAAKLLAIDFADAVVGFSFKGRHGTAIINGAIVAQEYLDAVNAVIEGFVDQAQSAEDEARSIETLRLWKRFLIGLRIAKRIGLLDIQKPDADGKTLDIRSQLNEAEDEANATVEAGGFLPDDVNTDRAMPTASTLGSRLPLVESPIRAFERIQKHKLRSVSPKPKRKEASSMGLASEDIVKKESLVGADVGGPVYDPGLSTTKHANGAVIAGKGRTGEPYIEQPQAIHVDHNMAARHEELTDDDTGGGFMVDNMEPEVKVFIDIANERESRAQDGIATEVDLDKDKRRKRQCRAASANSQVRETQSPVSVASSDASDDVYQDSLPSRDPEEDAEGEPDWLDHALEG